MLHDDLPLAIRPQQSNMWTIMPQLSSQMDKTKIQYIQIVSLQWSHSVLDGIVELLISAAELSTKILFKIVYHV
jgi:hypothetical protein